MARLSERPRRYVKARLTSNAAAAGHRRWDSRCRGCSTECNPVLSITAPTAAQAQSQSQFCEGRGDGCGGNFPGSVCCPGLSCFLLAVPLAPCPGGLSTASVGSGSIPVDSERAVRSASSAEPGARGRLIARVLAGAWRAAPPPPDFTVGDLEAAAPLPTSRGLERSPGGGFGAPRSPRPRPARASVRRSGSTRSTPKSTRSRPPASCSGWTRRAWRRWSSRAGDRAPLPRGRAPPVHRPRRGGPARGDGAGSGRSCRPAGGPLPGRVEPDVLATGDGQRPSQEIAVPPAKAVTVRRPRNAPVASPSSWA